MSVVRRVASKASLSCVCTALHVFRTYLHVLGECGDNAAVLDLDGVCGDGGERGPVDACARLEVKLGVVPWAGHVVARTTAVVVGGQHTYVLHTRATARHTHRRMTRGRSVVCGSDSCV